jgi:ketosteroid isomerase-like protein
MGSENLEAARGFFRELNAATAAGESVREIFVRYVDRDCVSELGAMEGTWRGPDAGARYIEGTVAFIEGLNVEPEEFIEVGDRIVMPFHLHGRARETGLPISFHYTQLFTMRDGRFTHVRMFSSKERALAAAGTDSPGDEGVVERAQGD